jgi:hypothetical protein
MTRLQRYYGSTALSRRGREDAFAIGGIVVLGMAMFFDVFIRGGTVATFATSDVFEYFGPLRHFAFGELAQGNFPLWNPHILCGNPCFGAYQAGLLYPFNAIYLFLPLGTALNLDLWFHVTLFGLAMYAWARNTLSPLPAFYSAVVPMFGPFFLHVMCGHLPMLACLAWTPVLFLAYDKLRDGGGYGWFLAGTLSAAMQTVSGWPQGLMMVVIVFGLYWALTIWTSKHPIRVSGLVIVMALCAGAIGAAQLWTGMETSAESVRGEGLPYAYAMGFSLPRENLLTYLVPTLFGNEHHSPYFAWNHFWESCAFIGVTTLVLAALGALSARWERVRVLVPMLLALLVLALGGYTPVHRLLYDWVPGFDQLRAMGRFIIYFSMFAALLSGEGFASLLAGRRDFLRVFAGVLFVLAGILLFSAATTFAPYSALPMPSWILDLRHTIVDNWQSRFPKDISQIVFAVYSMVVAAGTCVVLAVACLYAKRHTWAVIALAVLGLIEMGAFARIHRGETELRNMDSPLVATVYKNDPGEYRVLMRDDYNAPLTERGFGVWGYDALFLDRYAQFFGHTVNHRKRVIDTSIPRVRYSPLHGIVRCKYVLDPENPSKELRKKANSLPRFLIVHDAQIVTDRDAAFAAMDDANFDPERTVLLEQNPTPAPEPDGGDEEIRVVGGDTDHTELEVSLSTPGILVVTDAYAKSWHVRTLDANPPQDRYDLVPANYAIRAVPLAAGDHRIVMEYAPPGYIYGRWISLAAALVYLVATGAWTAQRWKHKTSRDATESIEPGHVKP